MSEHSTPPSAVPALAVRSLTVAALVAGGLAVGTPALAASSDARITEIHYDNAGTDTGESVEVTATGAIEAGTLSIVLYNGNGGAPYDTDPVPASASGVSVLSYPADGVQNGAPDAVALVDAAGTVLEFWSYEGTLTATSGPAAGATATDIGVAETNSTPAGQSLQRTPGTDTWTGPAAETFGEPNTGGGEEQPTGPACDSTSVPIGTVQGRTTAEDDDSPLTGQTVTIAGTVVGDLQQGGLDGVYVQDAGDADPATSDGVFVYRTGPVALELGDRVVVRGTVADYPAETGSTEPDALSLTELTDTSITVCGTGDLQAATDLPMPSTDAQREALEGMLVTPPAGLTVTDVYDLNRYGEVVLASGGRLVTPTEAAEPGAASAAAAQSNEERSLVLDDGSSTTFGSTGTAPPYLTADDPVRVGDTAVISQAVVLSYGFEEWRLQPADGTAAGTTFEATNPRPAAPEDVAGELRVADFNVLNYFVDTPDEITDPPSAGEPRGATSEAEFQQQQAKIIAAMTAMDADVFTLHEIENSAVYSADPADEYEAVETLVAALEAADGHDWDIVRAHEDTDAITNAIIYRTDRVTAVGDPMVPADLTAFDNARTPIAQTFSAGDETFSVIANHLKSKGSSCGADSDDLTAGGQGNCNGDRVAQAAALVDFAAEVAQVSGDDDVLLTGDFNSYRNEAPLDVLREAGFTEVYTEGEYSYVFDGASGSLDHVFASGSMFGQVTGHTIWDVNAVESYAYEYEGREDLYRADPYRSSDHNPTLIGLTLESDVPAAATISDPRPLRGDRVTVTGTGFEPGERVTATLASRPRGQLGTAVADGDGTVSITFSVPVALPAGDQQVLLTGSSGETASTGFQLRTLLQEVLARLTRWFARG